MSIFRDDHRAVVVVVVVVAMYAGCTTASIHMLGPQARVGDLP